MISINPKDIPIPHLHGYLLGAIGPRPIAFASTINEKGEPNLSPFSFFNVFSANPPIAIFSPARRGRDNTTKHTYENVKKVPEVVINVVNYNMVEQMSLASTEYPDGVNEFEKAGFTMLKSDIIKPFRVAESPVQFECIVKEVVELGAEGGAGNLVISEVVKIHIAEDILDETGKIDNRKIDLVGRMGGDWYVRAHGNALFEVAKPLTTLGIGIDQIPHDIRNSSILSGNDLGKLGNTETLPDETAVNEYKLIELSELFQEFEDDPKTLEIELHKLAAQLLSEKRVEDAWKTLLAFNNE
ncbi:MAG: flavin reductase family protein [Flavobacteriales bacterium]|nr:flavin reductase family protein [Flavobacteriales bacterium]